MRWRPVCIPKGQFRQLLVVSIKVECRSVLPDTGVFTLRVSVFKHHCWPSQRMAVARLSFYIHQLRQNFRKMVMFTIINEMFCFYMVVEQQSLAKYQPDIWGNCLNNKEGLFTQTPVCRWNRWNISCRFCVILLKPLPFEGTLLCCQWHKES